MPNTRLRPLAALTHPLWIACLALLVVNDHVLKEALPGAFTGKLSDFVGLVVAPLVLASALRLSSRRALLLAHLAVGAVFAAINVSAACAHGFEAMMALTPWPWAITVDPTDLVALPALALSWKVLVPAAARPARDLKPILSRAAFGAGALACVATSPPPEPMPQPPPGQFFPDVFAHLVIGNDTDSELVLRVRPLADTVFVDCAEVAREPSRYLSRELFGSATVWLVQPGRAVGIGENTFGGGCNAALVDGALTQEGVSQNIPMFLLFWDDTQFPQQSLPTTVDGINQREIQAAMLVTMGGPEGAPTPVVDSHAARFPAPLTVDNMPAEGCGIAPEGAAVEWSTPVPTGKRVITELMASPDGCVRYTMAGVAQPWYLCGTPDAHVFEIGDIVFVSELTGGQDFENLAGVEILGDRATVRVGRGADLVQFGEGSVTIRSNDECRGQHDSCGNYLLPLEVEISGESVPTTTLVSVGDAVELNEGNGTLHLLRAHWVPVGSSECLPEGAATDQVVESVYVEHAELRVPDQPTPTESQ